MATDQPTDAYSIRLEEKIRDGFVQWARGGEGADNPHKHRWNEAHAALDTLIRYHRAAGAVEALAAVKCRGFTMAAFADPYTCIEWNRLRRDFLDEQWCDRCTALAAAQERLALLEQPGPWPPGQRGNAQETSG